MRYNYISTKFVFDSVFDSKFEFEFEFKFEYDDTFVKKKKQQCHCQTK